MAGIPDEDELELEEEELDELELDELELDDPELLELLELLLELLCSLVPTQPVSISEPPTKHIEIVVLSALSRKEPRSPAILRLNTIKNLLNKNPDLLRWLSHL